VPVRSIPTSTKIAIAAAPWIFIAHAFAPISKSPGDETRSFQYAHAAPLKKSNANTPVEKISLQAL